MSTKNEINALIGRDAEEFGVISRHGGWRLGLLVARSVELDKGNGKRGPAGGKTVTTVTPFSDDFEKWSARQFAKRSGTSTPRVLRFLKTWDAAAADDIVPESALLVPGEELDGMDDLDPDLWDAIYPGGEPLPQEKAEAYTAAAVEEDTTTNMVAKVAKNKKALAAAIKADPEVAKAAHHALADLHAKKGREAREKAAAKQGIPVEVMEARQDQADAERKAAQDSVMSGVMYEAERRNALHDLQHLAAEIKVKAEQWAQTYGCTGVADEIEWVHEISADITDAQWKIASFAVDQEQTA